MVGWAAALEATAGAEEAADAGALTPAAVEEATLATDAGVLTTGVVVAAAETGQTVWLRLVRRK